ncbi:MAG: hypothetical protein C0403_12725 [Desulfobacterium sp.]|nr:hypothetical protein [Desulfobacterium sp.]
MNIHALKSKTMLMWQYRSTSPEADLILSFIMYELDYDIEKQQHIVELLGTEIDWKKFINIALDNEILPSVYPILKEFNLGIIPDNIVEYFYKRFERNKQRNEVLSEELVNLNNLFSSNNIQVINYKGPETVCRLGIDISKRQFNDLYFLFRHKDISKMNDILSTAGYKLWEDNARHQNLQRKDFTYIKTASSNGKPPIRSLPNDLEEYREIRIEPHLSIVEYNLPLTIDYDGLWNRAHHIEFMGERIRTFSKEDLLFILCISGCKAKWKNLKLIRHIANTLRALPDIDLEICLERARETGGEKMLLMGFLLANELMGPVRAFPDTVERAMSEHRLIKHATKVVYNRSQPKNKYGLLPSFPAQFSFLIYHTLDRLKDRIKYAWRTCTQPRSVHFRRIPLPKFLHCLYLLIVPVHDLLIWPIGKIVKRSLSPTRSEGADLYQHWDG